MREVFLFFFRLGILGFGGPLALIAHIQADLVEKRKWISLDHFQKAFALIKAMPGTIAFSTSVYISKIRAGWPGAFLAGFGLVFPSFVMMILFGMFLKEFEASPLLMTAMVGMQVAALAVILTSLRGLVGSNGRHFLFWIIAFVSVGLASVALSWEPLIIVGFGGLLAFARQKKPNGNVTAMVLFLILTALGLGFASDGFSQEVTKANEAITSPLLQLAWVCFKAGAFVFGSGIAIVPMLAADVVQRFHWMSNGEFLNAVALGQITPGPVVITATFIGYEVAGLTGALVGTVAIFFPPFVHMTTWFPSAVQALSRKKWITDFTFGALAAVTGTILVATYKLAASMEWKVSMIVIALMALAASWFKWFPSWAIIPVGGGLLVLFSHFGY